MFFEALAADAGSSFAAMPLGGADQHEQIILRHIPGHYGHYELSDARDGQRARSAQRDTSLIVENKKI